MHKDPEEPSGSGSTAWATLWPLIGVALLQEQRSGACEFAGPRLDSSPQRLPGALTAMLDKAVAEWKKRRVRSGVYLPHERGYL
jgi:hypothetical protein